MPFCEILGGVSEFLGGLGAFEIPGLSDILNAIIGALASLFQC